MSFGIVPPVKGKSRPRTTQRTPGRILFPPRPRRFAANFLGRCALRLRGPGRFGQPEILREMVHADHLVAQLSRAPEQTVLFGTDDARGERGLGELLGRRSAYRPRLLRRADLGLDRLGLDRRVERGLEAPERLALRLRQVHAGAEPVA